MLVRKDNEIEIWTDVQEKGRAKKCFVTAIAVMVIFMFGTLVFDLDYSIKETYYFILIFVGFPPSLFLIAGFINLLNERQKTELRVKVNSDYIEINRKKQVKKISLGQISKVNAVSSKYENCIVIFYIEENSEKKYSFPISASNRGLVIIALKEYKQDIVIQEKK